MLDGFPRTINQADALEELLAASFGSKVALVPLFDTQREEAIRRIMGRSQQESRADDSREVAEKRYEVYLRETAPLIDYYERKGVLVRLDANQPISEVTESLMQIIAKQPGVGRSHGG